MRRSRRSPVPHQSVDGAIDGRADKNLEANSFLERTDRPRKATKVSKYFALKIYQRKKREKRENGVLTATGGVENATGLNGVIETNSDPWGSSPWYCSFGHGRALLKSRQVEVWGVKFSNEPGGVGPVETWEQWEISKFVPTALSKRKNTHQAPGRVKYLFSSSKGLVGALLV
jgi:hypothetical protein